VSYFAAPYLAEWRSIFISISMDISLKQINDIALPEVVARGRAYFHEGRVQLETVGDNFVRATVKQESQRKNVQFANAKITCEINSGCFSRTQQKRRQCVPPFSVRNCCQILRP
ncbi:MAG: hypothetical protein AAB209_08510, partial [Bacteroidota bacterium]